jgi:hypothetical protein
MTLFHWLGRVLHSCKLPETPLPYQEPRTTWHRCRACGQTWELVYKEDTVDVAGMPSDIGEWFWKRTEL